MGQISWTVSFVMASLFAVALIGFMIGFASDNNAAVNIASDSQINTLNSEINSNLTQFNSGSSGTYDSIVNSTITGSDTLPSGTPFAITPVSVFGVLTSILKIGFNKITGGNPAFSIFIVTFAALIIFITAMYLWKTWGGRNPE